jgi:betaine-aldehyde dehydrogenase
MALQGTEQAVDDRPGGAQLVRDVRHRQAVLAREEIFGPLGTIIAFDSDDEAVAIANDCDYALAATVWTSDIGRAHTVARKVRAGAVAVNGWSPLDPALPWGGTRLSGHGRDLGWAGIEANTEEKTVTVVL